MNNQNNLNILRLIFASTVIISHSFPLTGNLDFFSKITNNQIDLGRLSVEIFFIISGYLIFKSLNYSKSILNYLWKRILRLFPALIIMLLLTIITVLFINTSDDILRQRDFYTYLPNNITLYRVQYVINGVFENNPYPNGINGSLWSLCYEFTMYLLLVPFFWIKNKKLSLSLLLIILVTFVYSHLFRPNFLGNFLSFVFLQGSQFYRFGGYFISGALLTYINLEKIKNNKNIILLTLLLTVSLFFNIYIYISIILLPIVIMLIGLSFNKYMWKFTERLGDLSYGIYIYGFIVQQVLMNYFILNPYELMIYSLVITFIFAYFSWHLIEKKVLRFKNYL